MRHLLKTSMLIIVVLHAMIASAGEDCNTYSVNVEGTTTGLVSPHWIAEQAYAAGWRCGSLVTAVAIALAESGGYSGLICLNKSDNCTPDDKGDDVLLSYKDWGLWQINDDPKRGYPDCIPKALDPVMATKYAYIIFSEGGFGRWSAYNNGSYKEKMSVAKAACEQYPSLLKDCVKKQVQVVRSLDPNEIVGPTGIGIQRWISGTEPFRYALYFENVPTATAPAAEVVVTDTLEKSSMDLQTVSLKIITLADKVVEPELVSAPIEGLREYNTAVDLRPQKQLIVKINVKLNLSTGLMTWRFTSTDPATGNPPDDPMAGFLDPGAQGCLLYTVNLVRDLPSGTVIRNKASIVFDFNAPIETNQWTNTLDAVPPASNVNRLPATTTETSFQVSWSGSDDPGGSGVANYDIYVSTDGQLATPWLDKTELTEATFTGEPGHTYGFFSVARDAAGNVEAAPAQPDASIDVPVLNQAPNAVDDLASTSSGIAVDINVLENDSDPDGDPLTVTGVTQGANGASSTNPDGTVRYIPAQGFSGTDTFTYTISDGNSGSHSANVTVTVVDTTAPSIVSLSASPGVLWPANHKMVAAAITVQASDNCDPKPVPKIVSVTSNEPVNGLGDGDTAPDWQITGDLTLLLRAERSGAGHGRVYTITIECRDASGNVSTANVQARVPHDRR